MIKAHNARKLAWLVSNANMDVIETAITDDATAGNLSLTVAANQYTTTENLTFLETLGYTWTYDDVEDEYTVSWG